MAWSTPLEDPIPLPDGRTLVSLKDAADYITKLPKRESDVPEWQTAIEVLSGLGRVAVVKSAANDTQYNPSPVGPGTGYAAGSASDQ